MAGNYGVDTELYAAELRFDALYESQGAQPVYHPLPKFPAVTRDIAVVCDKAVTVGALEDAIRKGAKGLLKEVDPVRHLHRRRHRPGQEERGLQPDTALR